MRRLALAWQLRPAWVEWPFTTHRRTLKRTQRAFWNGYRAGRACEGVEARVVGYAPPRGHLRAVEPAG